MTVEATADSGIMSKEEAEQLTSELKKAAEWLSDKFVLIAEGKPWLSMGYASIDMWWVGEGLNTLQLSVPIRQSIAYVMAKQEYMKQQDVANTLGVSQGTVSQDIKKYESIQQELLATNKNDPLPDEDPSSLPTLEDLISEPDPIKDEVSDIIEMSKWNQTESDLRKKVENGLCVVVDERVSSDYQNILEWAKANHLYVHIGRRGDKKGLTGLDWGNPFVLDEDGVRSAVIEKYRKHYLPYKTKLMDNIHLLKGKVLGCWCAPAACHGDVLADLVNAVIDGEVVE